MNKIYKLKDNIEVKDLEKYGFDTFMNFNNTYLIAVRDSRDDKCKLWQYYRLGINSKQRTFHKTKYRGCGKCLLSLNVTKNDIQDLIKNDMVEVVKE